MGADCCSHGPSAHSAAPRDPLSAAATAAATTDDNGLTAADRTSLQALLTYLATPGQSGIKLRQGVLNGSARVDYFKGKHAASALEADRVRALLLTPPRHLHDDEEDGEAEHHHGHEHHHVEQGDDADCDKTPKEPSLDDRITYTLEALVLVGGLVRVDKAPKQKNLSVTPLQQYDPTEYFVLAHKPTSPWHMAGSVGLVVVVLAGVMFPLWPESLRQGVVYISYALLALLGLLAVLAVARLVAYGALVAVGKPGWLFPNLFADVGIVESFVPVWEWEASGPAGSSSKKAKAKSE
ncbi:translocation protein Sec62-domain-containing protein [Blastocladiella britannica]|nr:translocation protein Sec62-domain-containing protein [Blastocladiella britannica]